MGRRAVTFVVDDERDADLLTWLAAQANKSAALRGAIRAYMRSQNGESQEAIIRDAVQRAMGGLPDLVTGAVKDALGYQFTRGQMERTPGGEDPELAARLDAQLDDFFGD